jgi:hypothetical protein
MSETPEGFLICENVAIARAGDLIYGANETELSNNKDITVVSRNIEDITAPDVIASFEGKPVTINHPDGEEFVTPENWRQLAVGIVQNVRAGVGEDAGKLMADLLLTDYEAISAVKSNKLRQLSCGYEADFLQTDTGRGRQENIRGNHVALVQSGRCGAECAIFDSAPKFGDKRMSVKDKMRNIFSRALDEAMPVDVVDEDADVLEMLKKLMARVDALEKKSGNEVDVVEDGCAQDKKAKDADVNIDDRLANIEAALLKLAGMAESDEDEEQGDAEMYLDSDTLARAEILCPGIGQSKDIKAKSLSLCYNTPHGKKTIDSVLGSKSFDSVDKDLLFITASELIKNANRETNTVKLTFDKANVKNEVMTAAKLNERFKTFYKAQG